MNHLFIGVVVAVCLFCLKTINEILFMVTGFCLGVVCVVEYQKSFTAKLATDILKRQFVQEEELEPISVSDTDD